MVGTKYSWKGYKKDGYARLFEKLDKGLCNIDWRMRFREGNVRVLSKLNALDH